MRALLAALIRLATGVRLLHEIPHDGGPAIIFANHASHMDFVVVWAALPEELREQTRPAAAEDYWTSNRLRRWIACRVFRAILILRRNVCRGNHPVDRLGIALEAGESVILFPEGGRSESEEPGEFKSGLFHLARRYPDIPLVPVQLENLSRILPKGSTLPVPLIAQARFLAPIRIEPGEAKRGFLDRARRALLDHPSG